MEKLETKLEKLKTDLYNSFNSEDLSLPGLELKLLKTEELIETGFVDKNVKSILPPKNEENMRNIDEYFESKCLEIMPEDIEPINGPTEPINVGEQINYFKYGVVNSVIKKEIINYINLLKKKTYDNNDIRPGDDEDMPF